MADITKLGFYSELNYLKKDADLSGSVLLNISGGGVFTHIVTHNLGYVPNVAVGAELYEAGVIWSMPRTYYEGITETLAQIQASVTTTQLIIDIVADGALGTREVYWNIYLDYGN